MEFFYPTANFVQANFTLKFCRQNISFIPQPHFFPAHMQVIFNTVLKLQSWGGGGEENLPKLIKTHASGHKPILSKNLEVSFTICLI